jgi:tetratricopeptide (TPR) repeat protein
MQTQPRKFSLILPTALLLSIACWGQVTAIQGDVIGPDGKPLPNAQITITRTDQKSKALTTKTDKKGHYYYGGLGLGIWDLVVSLDGKDVAGQKGVNTQHGDAEANFNLKAALAAAAAAPAAAPPQGAPQGAAPQAASKEKEKIDPQAKDAAERKAKEQMLQGQFNTALEAEKTKNWDTAIDLFKKALDLDPTQAVIWSHIADDYTSRGDAKTGDDRAADYKQAADAYEKSLAIDPGDPVAHFNYGLVLSKLKQVDKAQAEITKAAELNPPGAGKYYYNLGAVLVNSGQNEAAGTAFQKAIAGDPDYAEAYYQYGVVLISKATATPDGKIVPVAGTVENLQKYLSLSPNGPNAEGAKALLATLGSTIDTNYKKQSDKKGKK